jgi:hypothetical protein
MSINESAIRATKINPAAIETLAAKFRFKVPDEPRTTTVESVSQVVWLFG